MRKRAGLARALVLDPEIMLFDEPDSGLDPVRTAFLNQLIVDLNAQIDATFLIVTHDINTARTVPDNIGLLYRRHLAMFGPREMLLSSEEPVVRQFLNAQTVGPIGMSEEKDADELAAERARAAPAAAHPAAARRRPTAAAPRPAPARRLVPENGVEPPPGIVRGGTPCHDDPARRPLDGRRPRSRVAGARSAQPASFRARSSTSAAPCSSRPFQSREFIQQAWFIASVTILPTALVAIPFGAVIALQVGSLIKQFGAQSFTGSASVLAVVRRPARSPPRC